ncbi:FAD-dependent monooxygenase [Klebsiella oxytoca]|uniref:FAD-dependent monooxygenase n=1 Tax=Klebsiella oxytoca TaxID=571 RepID=UPI00388F3AF5
MQYHLDGFRPGDPELFDAIGPAYPESGLLPKETDVLIIGCGPAGLTLAAQLSAFPDIQTVIVEKKPGPMKKGQADGISCRSMEMFNAFGFAEKILKQSCWVNETTFWKPDSDNPKNIIRNGRIQDVEDGLSEMPHVILNQARIHDMYLDVMHKSPTRMMPFYSLELVKLQKVADEVKYPVLATFEKLIDEKSTGEFITIKARYAVGCDGARSTVRKNMGRELVGDSANQAWGVMDVLAVTDFPDIRCKSLIQSAYEGNIIIIPREGGYLLRLYIELDKLSNGERVKHRNITVDDLINAAQRIFSPFKFSVKEVAWWSVYEIGQRITDKFDDVLHGNETEQLPHIFICGDACHTHSPKAGQGMNVSMGDAFNLGWKLISVLKGISPPSLLHTYSQERHDVAQDLIIFDREWSRIMSERPDLNKNKKDEPDFQRYFIQHGRYTAGMSVKYNPSCLTGNAEWQHLAPGFVTGTRFHSAPVIRLADVKPMQLGHTITSDGRWRIFIFNNQEDPTQKNSLINQACDFLFLNDESPVRCFTPTGLSIDSLFDIRFVFQQASRKIRLEYLSKHFFPEKGKYSLIDYEKVFCIDTKPDSDIFTLRGINRDTGVIVVIRPDQYIAHLLPLDKFSELTQFFLNL